MSCDKCGHDKTRHKEGHDSMQMGPDGDDVIIDIMWCEDCDCEYTI